MTIERKENQICSFFLFFNLIQIKINIRFRDFQSMIVNDDGNQMNIVK